MNAAFIGLGIMGSRMAANLLNKGFKLTVHNRSKGKEAPLTAKGAFWAESAADAARNADVLFTMLSTPEAVREAALGPAGFLDALRPKSLWVDCSTVNPSFSREMSGLAKARGIRMLDAPVAGSKMPAEQGKLLFLVGGDTADVSEASPFFEAMGQKTFHMGGPGMGAAMKMVVNLLMGESMLAYIEAVILGESLGIEKKAVLDTLLATPIAAPFMSAKRAKIEGGNFDPEFPLQWMQKDLHLAAVSAYEGGISLPAGNTAKEVYRLAMRAGLAEKDFSAVYDFLSRNKKEPG